MCVCACVRAELGRNSQRDRIEKREREDLGSVVEPEELTVTQDVMKSRHNCFLRRGRGGAFTGHPKRKWSNSATIDERRSLPAPRSLSSSRNPSPSPSPLPAPFRGERSDGRRFARLRIMLNTRKWLFKRDIYIYVRGVVSPFAPPPAPRRAV